LELIEEGVIMKKIITFLFASVILLGSSLSCSKEIKGDDYENNLVGRTVSFSVCVEDINTKATLSSNTDFTWELTDEAAVYSHEGERVILSPTDIKGNEANFKGTLTSGTDYIPEGALVVFPADRLASATTVTFPNTYVSPEETQGPTLVAKVSSKKLTFKYLAGTLKITITDVPSIATSLYVNTVNSTNDNEHVVCTGTYTVDFSGDTPSLTNPSSTGNNISISNTTSGSKTFYIPLPTTGDQKMYLDVKKQGGTTLYYASVTLSSANTVTRNLYAVLPDLTIAPSVYLVSDFSGSETSTLLSSHSGSVYSTDSYNLLNPGVNGKLFRFNVVYTKPDPDVTVNYGFDAVTDGSTSGTFTSGQTNKARLYKGGRYSIAFNYVDGSFTTTKTAGMYVIGTNNYWSFDNSNEHNQAMTSLAGGIYVWQGDPQNSGIKLYEAGKTSWTTGTYGSNGEGDGKSNISVTNGTTTTVLFRYESGDYWAENWTEGGAPTRTKRAYKLITNDATTTSVKLMGVGGDWSTGISFTKLYGNHIWGKEGVSVASACQVKFNVDGTLAGSYGSSDGDVDLSTFYAYGTLGGDGGKNFALPAGTYDIYFDDQDWYCYLVKK